MPDSTLSAIPFSAFKVGSRFLIEKAPVAQASSLRTLYCSHMRWQATRKEEMVATMTATGGSSSSSSAPPLVVSNGISCTDGSTADASKDFIAMVGSEPLTGDLATKETVLERIEKDSPKLVHIFAPGAAVGASQWAGIQLSQKSVLSAFELSERLAQRSQPLSMLLMTLCASSSGKQQRRPTEDANSQHTLSLASTRVYIFCRDCLLGSARARSGRRAPGLCARCSRWRVPLHSGGQVEYTDVREHHPYDAVLCAYGDERGKDCCGL